MHEKPGTKKTRTWSRSISLKPVTNLVQITHYISPNYTDHLKQIYTEYTVLKTFSLFRIFEQLALAFKNRVFPWNFHCVQYISYHWSFSATLRLPWKRDFDLKFFTVFNVLFTFRIFEQLAIAPKALYGIYIFYSDVRWGSWLV